MRKRRYEILLPLRYNDGRRVGDDRFFETREELTARFGAIEFQPNFVHGIWVHEGVRYEDELMRFVVDVDDTAENQQFFIDFKSKLISRFEQVEIYIVSYPIDIL
jgi:DNA repair protein RecO (recombination protein O)